MKLSKEQKIYFFLNFLAIVGLCASAITASKIVAWGPFVFPCSNIIFSLLTFPITDIISEIWGKEYAGKTVLISFAGQVLFVALIQISIFLPPAGFWSQQAAYESILGMGPRILLASMVAFLTAQMWDVFVYAQLKKATKGRYLWLRNNLSTFSSQFINSTLFIIIAFAGKQDIGKLIFGSIILKWVIAAVDTPLVYFGVRTIHRALNQKTIAYTEAE